MGPISGSLSYPLSTEGEEDPAVSLRKEIGRRHLIGVLGLSGILILTGGYNAVDNILLEAAPERAKIGSVSKSDLERILTEAEGRTVVWDSSYSLDFARRSSVLKGFGIPLSKYEDTLNDLVDSGDMALKDTFAAGQIGRDDILRVHTLGHLLKLRIKEFTRIDFTNKPDRKLIPGTLDYVEDAVNGTYAAGVMALEKGRAVNMNGGFHHAGMNTAEGFCFLNDTAIAIRKLQAQGAAKRAMIVDLDVHHGNGDASIFTGDSSVYIFDVYQLNNYPAEKIKVEKAFPLNTRKIDVTDEYYMNLLRSNLAKSIEKFNPDIIFYLAGADPYKGDRLGGFKLTMQGLKDRDDFVLSTAEEKGTPIAVLLAGGYSSDTYRIYANTIRSVLRSRTF